VSREGLGFGWLLSDVDRVYINQADMRERNHSIQIIGEIFVWLGPPRDDIRMALRILQEISNTLLEGFCEDLARQNVVARLSQLLLRFRRRHIWVSMLSHMGFSHRRGVLKTTI
jgi:hypothetical protein